MDLIFISTKNPKNQFIEIGIHTGEPKDNQIQLIRTIEGLIKDFQIKVFLPTQYTLDRYIIEFKHEEETIFSYNVKEKGRFAEKLLEVLVEIKTHQNNSSVSVSKF